MVDLVMVIMLLNFDPNRFIFQLCWPCCALVMDGLYWDYFYILSSFIYSFSRFPTFLCFEVKRSKVKVTWLRKSHGRMVASDTCCYSRVLLLPAWVCMSIRLPVCSNYYCCFNVAVVIVVKVYAGGCVLIGCVVQVDVLWLAVRCRWMCFDWLCGAGEDVLIGCEVQVNVLWLAVRCR